MMLTMLKRKIIVFSYDSIIATKGKIIKDKTEANDEYFFIIAIINQEKTKISPSK